MNSNYCLDEGDGRAGGQVLTDSGSTKVLLYICVKNPFCERDMERMGVEALEKHFDVQILDCTAWLMPKALATRGASKIKRENLRHIHSLREFKAAIGDCCGGFAVDYVGQFSIKAVLLFHTLKIRGFKLVVVDSGSYPSPDVALGKRSYLEKFLDAYRHGVLRQILNEKFIKLLLRVLPDQVPDFALVAGNSWKLDARFRSAAIKIPAHSFDYEIYRSLRGLVQERSADYAVYLDETIAGHEDNAELGFPEPATASRFYPALKKFLDGFETSSGMPVVVAGYPSLNQANCLGNFAQREVVYGKTAPLIRDAKLVFAHASTAISYAVLWRKPIVFLTSSEISNSWYQPWIEAPRSLLKASVVDIDDFAFDAAPKEWESVDAKSYERYEASYIKSKESPDSSLWERLACVKRLGEIQGS